MPGHVQIQVNEKGKTVYRLTSHRGCIEPDKRADSTH